MPAWDKSDSNKQPISEVSEAPLSGSTTATADTLSLSVSYHQLLHVSVRRRESGVIILDDGADHFLNVSLRIRRIIAYRYKMDSEDMMEDIAMYEDDDSDQFKLEFKPPYSKFFLAVLRTWGWYMLGAVVFLVYSWPYLQTVFMSWKKKRDDSQYDAKYHKDVDMSSKLLLATQLARERMQEKYLKEREIALQKEQERKEKKREEALRLLNNGESGYRLDGDISENSEPSSSKSNHKRGYNHLTGDGLAGRYRAPRRSGCRGGGCG
ncbi:hypothetical protein QAD02_008572 [Eretmocerus hayati]|uniref:Uncharacterized protein n=1 Tax=Eretmocerus hayati TaxID=131215 RepID=A0ACC2N6U4_9HYME|nr:hypothetical protein QAD02_008572 [Eretmocerus hayati]